MQIVEMQVVLGSKNPAKKAELATILADIAPRVELVDADWDAVDETGSTFEENALLKADAVHAATGLLSLADDSGLEVDALGGAPGVYSARYCGEHGDDEANTALVLERLRGVAERGARFRCVIAIVGTGIRETVDGVVEGTISEESRGDCGFGYDPIFEPLGWDRTFGEASAVDKAAVSHRGAALRRAAALLASICGG